MPTVSIPLVIPHEGQTLTLAQVDEYVKHAWSLESYNLLPHTEEVASFAIQWLKDFFNVLPSLRFEKDGLAAPPAPKTVGTDKVFASIDRLSEALHAALFTFCVLVKPQRNPLFLSLKPCLACFLNLPNDRAIPYFNGLLRCIERKPFDFHPPGISLGAIVHWFNQLKAGATEGSSAVDRHYRALGRPVAPDYGLYMSIKCHRLLQSQALLTPAWPNPALPHRLDSVETTTFDAILQSGINYSVQPEQHRGKEALDLITGVFEYIAVTPANSSAEIQEAILSECLRAMFTSSLLNGTFEDQFKRHLVMIESRHVIGDTNLVRNMVDYILTGPLSKNQLPN